MTRDNPQDFSRHSPDKLLKVFSKGHLLFWFFVAICIHGLVVVATSTGYIRDNYLDREGAAARKAAAANNVATAKAAAPAGAPAPAAATNVAAKPATTAAVTVVDGQVVPPESTNAAVLKRITEVARPEEIPTAPGDQLGISLEDTNTK